jgi:hypothetical protein
VVQYLSTDVASRGGLQLIVGAYTNANAKRALELLGGRHFESSEVL